MAGSKARWLRTYNQRDATMFSQKKVVLSTAIALSTAFTACAGDAAHSGTCAAQIAQLEQQVRGSGPTAPQSIEAQLHHQPTPRTVQNAESKAIADAKLRSNARESPMLAAKTPIGLAQILVFCGGHHTREVAQFTSSDSP
jgi:hypothetical protein